MRAIVTGGAGFIGSHVVDALLARGDEVHVLDDLSAGKRERVAGGAVLHVADVRAPDEVFDAVRPDAVLHLAAQANVRTSVERPDHDAEVNVLGTLRILEAARRHGAKIVFSSTGGAIYGECDGPVAEDAPRRPLAPYGTSKLCGEEYLATWNRLHETSHVVLRLGNVYGPRQEPHGEAGVVAIFMGLLRDGGTPRPSDSPAPPPGAAPRSSWAPWRRSSSSRCSWSGPRTSPPRPTRRRPPPRRPSPIAGRRHRRPRRRTRYAHARRSRCSS